MSEIQFEEYFCKTLIEKFFPHYRFKKSECPDWIDEKNDIGVECTIIQDKGIGFDKNDEEITAQSYTTRKLLQDYAKKTGKAKQGIKSNLEQHGEFIENIGYAQNLRISDFLPSLKNALEKKLKKLNNGYAIKTNNWLALYVQDNLYPWHFDEYLKELYSLQGSKKYKYQFDKILICGIYFVVFNMEKNQIELQEKLDEEELTQIKKNFEKEMMQ